MIALFLYILLSLCYICVSLNRDTALSFKSINRSPTCLVSVFLIVDNLSTLLMRTEKILSTFFYSIFCSFLFSISLSAQINYTANDIIKPYPGNFHFGVNPGAYQTDIYQNGGPIPWTDQELAELSVGLASKNLQGVGIETFRASLPDWFLEHFGYGIRDDAFDYYDQLGMNDNTLFLEHPSPEHTDPTIFCPDLENKAFANLYEPIWDGGANGTPYNDDNYYAAYVYKVVERYGDHVKFYEVWNEPDFSSTSNAQSPSGTPDSWWDKDPDPCDLLWFNAPVYYYIRMLRITYEVVKTLDPDGYVCVGGLGYPSFLDAIMRNTDNPNGGAPSGDYPLNGGAYFDVCSFHYYPHVSSAFREWNNPNQNWDYSRHTDQAIDAFQERYELFKSVTHKYGYNDITYPAKEFICTETNMPRFEFGEKFGGEQIQVNYAIKLAVFCNQQKIRHLHLFHLGETRDDGEIWQASDLFFFMGLYKNLQGANSATVERTNLGIGFKSASDIMKGYRYDWGHTASMNLGSNIRGGAFKNNEGDFLYVLWAKTHTDKSEDSQSLYTFPKTIDWAADGSATLTKKEWDYNVTNLSTTVGHQNIELTGTPIFLTISPDETDCNGLTLGINSVGVSCHAGNNGSVSVNPQNGTGPYEYAWNTGQSSALINNLFSGVYQVTVTDSKQCEVIQSITINQPFPLNVAFGSNDETIGGASDGNIATYVSGGSPPYFYNWSNGATSAYVGNLPPGNYFVTITDNNGCSTNANVEILGGLGTECLGFSASISTANINCGGIHDGTASVIVENGNGPYAYLWNTGQNTQIINNLSGGYYSVSVFDQDNCETITAVSIYEPPVLGAVLIGTNVSDFALNDGSATAYPNGGTLPYTIEWSNGSTTANINNLPAGLYQMTLTDAQGCIFIDDIQIDGPFQGCEGFYLSTTVANNHCFSESNGFAAVSGQNGVPPYSYVWNTGQTDQGIGNLPNGTYRITVTDARSCEVIQAINIVSPPPISVEFDVTNETSQTATDGSIVAFVQGGIFPYTYLWSNGATDSYISNANSGIYFLTVTDANGCETISEGYIDNESADCSSFQVNTAVQSITCTGGSNGVILLIPVSGTAPFEYLWSTGETSSALNNISAGIYQATITDANNCNFIIKEVLDDPSSIDISFQSSIVGICSDKADISIDISGGQPPYTVIWSSGESTLALNEIPSGIYQVSVTDANDCMNVGEIQISLDNLLLQVSSTIQNVSCFGSQDGYVNIEVHNGTPPYTYEWSNGATTKNIQELVTGTYLVTVTDSESCSSIYSFAVATPDQMDIIFEINQPDQGGNNLGDITATAIGGTPDYSYLWNFGTQSASVSNLLPGTYQLTITDQNGCTYSEGVSLGLGTANENVIDENAITISPNPGKSVFNLEIDSPQFKAEKLNIFDLRGQFIRSEEINSNKINRQIDLGSLKAGTYLVKIDFEKGHSKTLKYVLMY